MPICSILQYTVNPFNLADILFGDFQISAQWQTFKLAKLFIIRITYYWIHLCSLSFNLANIWQTPKSPNKNMPIICVFTVMRN